MPNFPVWQVIVLPQQHFPSGMWSGSYGSAFKMNLLRRHAPTQTWHATTCYTYVCKYKSIEFNKCNTLGTIYVYSLSPLEKGHKFPWALASRFRKSFLASWYRHSISFILFSIVYIGNALWYPDGSNILLSFGIHISVMIPFPRLKLQSKGGKFDIVLSDGMQSSFYVL